MCFNEYVSIATFITTTIFNYILLRTFKGNKEILSIVIIWEWIILMQFFEALIWLSKHKKTSLNTIGSYGAYIANILQPLIVYLSIILLTKQRKEYKLVFGVLVLLYLVYCIERYITKIRKKIKYLTNKDTCSNINYAWWKEMNSGVIYVILLILMFIFANPKSIYIPQLLYILLTLLMSIYTSKSCGNASVWCFMATMAPLLTLIYHKYIEKI
jgi:hypothetical protein